MMTSGSSGSPQDPEVGVKCPGDPGVLGQPGLNFRVLVNARNSGLAVTFVAAVGDPPGGDLERRQHDSRLEDVGCCRVNLSNPTSSSSAAAVSTNSRMLTDQCSRLPSGSIASTNGVDRSTKPRAPSTRSSIGGNAPSCNRRTASGSFVGALRRAGPDRLVATPTRPDPCFATTR
jgi:hypothetical protein